AWFQSSPDKIYFGGPNGVTIFNPDEIAPDPFNPAVKLTGFRVFNRNVGIHQNEVSHKELKILKIDETYYLPAEISTLDQLILTHRERVFSFHFASLDFRNAEKINYAYVMEGFEDNWNFVGTRREATYTNLSPGKYIFRVKGTNAGGEWSLHEASLAITILPPFWKTTWFILLLVLLLLTMAILSTRRIIIVQKRKAIEEKEKMELQLKTIKNQIDPHFAFNAINMIGSMVYKSDPDTVYDHFSKLAQLIRSTLKDSAKISRSLKEEIEFVKNYVEIQQARFKGKFKFQLEIDKHTNLNIEVPKMIIQTYVENAIKHGLVHKEGDGILLIGIKGCEQGLQIVISDNGIGRQKASSLNRQSTGMGLKIVEQIFSMYKKLYHYEITQEIIDLKDETGKPEGTEVIITINQC
ncbi:MAG: histidine kinase, partial [Bacteroidales bacterium]|nr:histidine kinase [Bacteroidales bacterium]